MNIPEKILQAGCDAYAAMFLNGNGSLGDGIEAAYFAIHGHDDWVRAGPPAWTGEGLPPVGTVCEVLWNESRMEYLRTKVFGVNEHGKPIHRFDEGPKKYEYQADALVTATGTKVFRPIRTPEQIAAEEREAGVEGIRQAVSKSPNCKAHGVNWDIACAIYDAGYRKQVQS